MNTAGVKNLERLVAAEPPLFMGILNTTPDSFSDGGEFTEPEAAAAHAETLMRAGAAIIDIGGESTGPGSSAVNAEEEWRRVEGAVAAISNRCILSIDTFKSDVAERALKLGAAVVNDVSALRYDPRMGQVAAEHNAYVVLMHSKELDDSPHASQLERAFSDVINDTTEFLERAVERAVSAGIERNKIIIDPGMGKFVSADPEISWEIVARLDELKRSLPFPILLSASRKGFLGGAVSQRDPISQLLHLAAIAKGAKIIRTHNVAMLSEFFGAWKRLKMV
ncbi:MAG: dihydropteroate synthase [Bdellovibrionales bacterium]|nr:dihydropteroate synthase [Bdellovibrionales bacterium]